MGSLAQISSGAIRCSFNTRFRTRFRRVLVRIPREVPSIYLRAAVLRILTHWAVQKMATTEQDMEIGLTSWVIAVSLPVGQGESQRW